MRSSITPTRLFRIPNPLSSSYSTTFKGRLSFQLASEETQSWIQTSLLYFIVTHWGDFREMGEPPGLQRKKRLRLLPLAD